MTKYDPRIRQAIKKRAQPALYTDQQNLYIIVHSHEVERSSHGNVGAMIPPHAIDSDGNSHFQDKRKGRHLPEGGESVCLIPNSYSPDPFVTFLPL